MDPTIDQLASMSSNPVSSINASSPTGTGWTGILASIGQDVTGVIQSLKPTVVTPYGTIAGTGAIAASAPLLSSSGNSMMLTIVVVGVVVLIGAMAFARTHK